MTAPDPALPTPAELNARRQEGAPGAAPLLPTAWRAQVLLTPWGDSAAALENYAQLVVADVVYDWAEQAMRVSVYLTQDLRYFDFLFVNGRGWYWIDSTPDGEPGDVYGPFATTLQVPAPDFLRAGAAQFGNSYPLMGLASDHWVVPIPPASAFGPWFTFRRDTGHLFRVFNIDSDNPLGMPVLGSYYIANVPTLTIETTGSGLRSLIESRPARLPAGGYANPMVTQQDIQRAMAHPLASSACTREQIQTRIPGLTPAPDDVPIPVWTDKTYIEGWSLGTDLIPYYTRVHYWFSYGKQQTTFIGLGLGAGRGTYDDRQDHCLAASATNVPQYRFQNGAWTPICCAAHLDGVGLPRPHWLSRDGKAMATIADNPSFGLRPGQSLNLFAAPSDRGQGSLALFWAWFTADGSGVLFSEGNYLDSLSHGLQVIDYTRFDRDASWITESDFSDPCPDLPACATEP